MEKTFKDTRINNMLCMYEYEEIANEYCQREFGRNINGGCRMGWETFTTKSYAKDYTEKQIDIIIDYAKQTVTLSMK